jgi:hypothetical protein
MNLSRARFRASVRSLGVPRRKAQALAAQLAHRLTFSLIPDEARSDVQQRGRMKVGAVELSVPNPRPITYATEARIG